MENFVVFIFRLLTYFISFLSLVLVQEIYGNMSSVIYFIKFVLNFIVIHLIKPIVMKFGYRNFENSIKG